MLQANDSYAQNTKVSLNMINVKLGEVIDELETTTEFKFFYNTKAVDLERLVSIKLKKATIKEVLDRLFSKIETGYEIKNRKILLFKKTLFNTPEQKIDKNSEHMQQVINGTILDENGNPLPGANIIEKGTTNGVQTNFDGNFSITVSNNAILVISYIGYASQEITVGSQTNITVQLIEDAAALDEVVVVGFGEQSVRKVTAAISQVSAEELGITERPVTNIETALVGSLPGLVGFNANGSPGENPNFSIRGASTLNNNNANVLVIIDDFEGTLADVNPQDIETVTILKDAAAVAVYGARGANGVLLVTTKKTRRNNKVDINYNFNGSFQSRGNIAETLTARELVAFENIAVTGDPTGGGDPSAPYSQTVIDLAESGFYPETQWPDALYNGSAFQQSHNFSAQGGSEKTGYLLSAGSLQQNGLITGGDNFKRLNLRLKIDTDITDWLTVGTNTVITNRIRNQVPVSIANELLGSPFFPVQTVDGIFVQKGSAGEANPIALAQSGSFTKTVDDAINLQLYAKVKPFKNFWIEERVSFIKNNANIREFDNVYDFVSLNLEDPDSYTNPDSPNRGFVAGIPDARRLVLTSTSDYRVTALTRLNYNLNIGDHNFGALLGFQIIQGQSEGFRTGRQGFLLDEPLDLSLGQTTTPVPLFSDETVFDPLGNTSFRGGNATTLSYFGRFNYDYKGRYIAELSFRYDGSSRFLDNNRYGFFPSASLAWNVGEESFISNIDAVDRLKLRLSYGIAGDDSGIERSVLQFANVDVTGFPFGGQIQPGIFLGDPASNDLTWETATIFNAGLDFSLWRGKFQLSTEFFVNNRDDILDFAITPTEFGFGNVPANLYSVKSWGWEFDFTHRNSISKDFSYWLNANLAYYDNEITDLAGRQSPELAVGQSINQRLGFETDGFFDNQAEIDAVPIDQSGVGGTSIGGFKYVDQNNDGVIDADDRVILTRNSDDNLLLGFNIGASYKSLSLSARFYGSLDRTQWWNEADAHEPFLNGTNAFTYQTNFWSQDNPNAFFPIPQGNGIQGYNSDISGFIFDNDFIKLQNITLAYDFNDDILRQLGFLSSLNLTLSIENIGTIWTNSPISDSGWDPELGAGLVQYPLPVTTSIGLNVGF